MFKKLFGRKKNKQQPNSLILPQDADLIKDADLPDQPHDNNAEDNLKNPAPSKASFDDIIQQQVNETATQPLAEIAQKLAADPTKKALNSDNQSPDANLEISPQIQPEKTAQSHVEKAQNHVKTPKLSWFQRLTKGLSKSNNNLVSGIGNIFTKRKLDDETLEALEDILIQADLGTETAINIAEQLATSSYDKEIEPEEIRKLLNQQITNILAPVAIPLTINSDKKPYIILMTGVNGAGKTTSIGKLAAKFQSEGKSVMLAAGDTFRAAAVQQLMVWGERANVPVITGAEGADAAGLAFEAISKAKQQNIDILMIDTAGRLQNRSELMDELMKIVRVIKKQDATAPHASLLVLDATTGQNAVNQAQIFSDKINISGLIMTKLDGTAKGGILVAIAAKIGLPVHYIGVGEGIEDMEPFIASEFADALTQDKTH